MTKTLDRLSTELASSLQGEKMVSLITVDADTKLPQLSVVSWVNANPVGTQIKIALGHKASSITNIQSNPTVIVGMIGEGSCYSVRGRATVSEVFEKTMKLCVVTIDIEEVENVMFYGGKVTVEPEYEKTYNPDLAKKLDIEVYELLR
ncbi:pyridoxamine 5'-phosphate oxidase [Bacillus sp. AFS076308]|uniref:pyridoxamine 5'-phosphate oxidase n=1 Tax=unclassified Bacillus (in: firmicutes) TaxID=185979 RepID=UPI000BF79AA0|nr:MULTISPECIES: pyridoxamine 5'-phosphate oxidase [unclassified Bacillus (in: firmicutes)]PFO06286.1 pyridoxamine 5'-phosphate oxidase [Bacillus sp. AFS076308]PGV53855.1 pyridoxamine 5'-phosphate oxidase [Bacillus sp. AFS037270]